MRQAKKRCMLSTIVPTMSSTMLFTMMYVMLRARQRWGGCYAGDHNWLPKPWQSVATMGKPQEKPNKVEYPSRHPHHYHHCYHWSFTSMVESGFRSPSDVGKDVGLCLKVLPHMYDVSWCVRRGRREPMCLTPPTPAGKGHPRKWERTQLSEERTQNIREDTTSTLREVRHSNMMDIGLVEPAWLWVTN